MRILSTVKETYADGPGIRYSIYVAGCTNACPGCHNPDSWSFNQGEELTDKLIAQIKAEIKANPLLSGITVSGGDPMHPANAEGLAYLLSELNELKKNIWVYTGYTLDELLSSGDSNRIKALNLIDVLVDGKYMQELRDTSTFKGSTNQRIIKLREVLK